MWTNSIYQLQSSSISKLNELVTTSLKAFLYQHKNQLLLKFNKMSNKIKDNKCSIDYNKLTNHNNENKLINRRINKLNDYKLSQINNTSFDTNSKINTNQPVNYSKNLNNHSARFKTMWIFIHLFIVSFLMNGIVVNGQSPANNESPFASILYTGVLRGKVALPCDVSAPSEDDSVALILWYKDDALAPIYTLDARKGSLDQARTLTSSLLEGRAYFNLHNRPAFLQIDPIKLEDAGDYRCRVDFKKARTVNTVISLKVIVPPEEPEIKDANGKVLRGLIGPYAESSPLKLTCSTVGGKPRPSLVFYRDYTLLDDTFEYNEDITTNTVLIPSLTRHHLLSVFTCSASNNNITVPISTSITLDLNLKPSEVRLTQLSPTLVVNREARFQCSTIGARPQARVYFLFNGLRKDVKLNCKPDSQCLAVLTMQITKEMNGASLRCVAENPRIIKSEITDQIKLDVQYAPQLNLKLGSNTLSLQSIQEGNDIYFDCDIDANPIASKPITWRFNGEIIQSQTGVIQSNQTLVLQSVIKSQSGIYQCEVANKQGTSLSNPIELKVKFAPVCHTDYVFVFGVTFYETVHLRCDVDANPTDVQFFWKLHNSNQLDLVTYNQFNTSSILTYSPQMQQDYGVIECYSKNSVGLQQTPCYFQLTSLSVPNIPFTCEIRNLTENSFIIACTYDNAFHLQSRYNNQTNLDDYQHNSKSNNNNSKKDLLSNKKALYIFPITFYVCETYYQDQLISTQNLTIHNPYTNSYLDIIDSKELKQQRNSKNSGRKNEYNKFKFFVNHLNPNSDYVIKITALNRKGNGRPFIVSATTKKKPDRLFITKINDQQNQNLDTDYIMKNDLTGFSWLSNQQFKSIPITYLLSMISVILGILIFILIIRKKYKRLILMHSALRNNQLNQFATSSNAISISKLFPYNNKKPELMLNACPNATDCSLNNEQQFDHSLMGCCNVDYREDRDILMPRPNNSCRQLTTFQGICNQEVMNSNNNLNQLQQHQHEQQEQQLRELNFQTTLNQLALTNSLSANNNLASLSCSTRDLYDTSCLFNANLNIQRNSNLALINSATTSSNQNNNRPNLASLSNLNINLNNQNDQLNESQCPLTPPPSYEASTSMLNLPPQTLLLSPLTNSLIHNHHHHNQSSYVDYTSRYQSLNRKVNPKLEEFKQNNFVVKLDDCCKKKKFNLVDNNNLVVNSVAADNQLNCCTNNLTTFSSKSLDRKNCKKEGGISFINQNNKLDEEDKH